MQEKNPTDILRKEHDKVLLVLGRLEKGLNARDAKQSESALLVLEKEFSRHSLNKEEKALFPEIEKYIPRDGGPTGVMIMEHQDLVESIGNFKKAAKAKNFEAMNENGSHILNVLRPHIEKENNILFMIADMHLTDEQKELVLKKFEKFDSEAGG